MDETFKNFLQTGRTILRDTKMPRKIPVKVEKKGKEAHQLKQSPVSDDPHKVFVRKVVAEKPKKKDILEQIKRFIVSAEEDL